MLRCTVHIMAHSSPITCLLGLKKAMLMDCSKSRVFNVKLDKALTQSLFSALINTVLFLGVPFAMHSYQTEVWIYVVI